MLGHLSGDRPATVARPVPTMSKSVGKQFPPGYPPTGTDLCLLSMDGGGVRGISSLLILRKLMEAINPKDPPRPCDYFDMIGGTSTGGLIALMLGRMCLTVDECIEAYNELSPKVFAQVRHRIKLRNGETQGRFDHTALENGVRQLLEVYGMDAESLLKDPEESCSCKVFVCATSQQTGRPVILSNYYNERRGNEWLNKVKIWQAVRATSAATTFFDPMTIDDETFVDGATGANNPVNYLWSEAGDVWGNGDELDPVNVKCLVSIGTGVPALTSFGSDIPGIAKALKAISTDTEETANLFQQHHSKLFKNGNAFRFNVSKGLEAVGLQEVEKWSQIKGATLSYIQQEQTFVNLRKCALMLQQRGWTRRLAEAIVRVANPSIEALNHDENHISHVDLQWLTHTVAYEKWITRSASLHFPEWNTRREQIEKADEGTNLWIWENQQYEGWDRADRGLLWIEGKPGSGKSVLARSMQQRIFASAVQTEAGFSIVAAWFYSTRLGDVGTSDISLLRSIIYEILSQEPLLFETTVEYYRRYPVTIDSEQNGSHARSWCSSEDFVKAGQQILEQISATGKSVICIIDAMDEADSVLAFNRPGHKSLATPRVTTLLKTLSSLATDIKDSRIKFVVLSRPEPLLELDFIRIQRGSSSVFRITLEHENAGDIGILVDRGLKVLTELMHSYDSEDEFGPSPNRGVKGGQRGLRNILHTIQASEEETLQRIRQYMLENARGVMLWVSLALKDLQETAARGMVTFAELESRLKSFPLGLDQFYERIIHDLRSTLSQEELLKSRSILMLISGSGALGRPLTLQELWEALAVPADLTRALASSSDPIINNRVIIRSWRDFRRQLKRYCGHLIELVSTKGVPDLCDSSEVGPDDTVQFIHRTLKDFLGAREKTDNFSISEHDAQVEVKELVSRYVEIAFRHTGALYRPKFEATEESSWKRNVEGFVKYMDQRILFAFAVAILSAESASNVRIHLGIDGTVLDNLVWPPIQEWNDEMISQAFMAESRFHPGTWTTTYSAGRIRAGLLGHAVYNACYEGLVTAMKNLNILYGIISPKYTFSNKYVLNNSALRVAIKYRLLDETLELTSHDRHRAFIPTRFVHIDRDPFIELARLCGDNEIFDVVQSTTANAYVGYGGVVRWDDIMNQYDDVYNIHGDYLYKINKRAREDENALEKQIRIERDEAEQPGNIVDVRDSIQDVICHVIPVGLFARIHHG
ncbi:hypothetical protein EKO27_g9246 [Xylaria grammica]|uniref:PNPLA domain-containing protein n=1 Tax=Xylaria grammica TaxID=363999 RepID=A0A439CUL4_9PEZI|nr:hypothetical protein EKO27_g9246 [Xylaria grammica]